MARATTQSEEVGRALRSRGGQHGDLHRRTERQRFALPRLRDRRTGRARGLRRGCLFAALRPAAEAVRAERLSRQAAEAPRLAGPGQGGPRADSRRRASDGRAADGLLRAGHRAAGERGPQRARRQGHRRPLAGELRLDALVLVPLQPQQPPHRSGDGRSHRGLAFSASAARHASPRRCTSARWTSRWCCTRNTNSTPPRSRPA